MCLECGVERLFVVNDVPQLVNESLSKVTWLRGYIELAVQIITDAKKDGQLGEALVAMARWN